MTIQSTMRSKHGACHCTIIDDLVITWKPLSIGDFFRFEDEFKSGRIAPSVIEDEIFRLCVTDREYVKDLDHLPAGTIDIVVQNILTYSGPGTIDEFNTFLDYNRELVQTPIHYLAPLILRAFPSYKLEDIYAMPYELFMLRLAQAEMFLLPMKIITEPILLTDGKPKKKKEKLSTETLRSIIEEQNKPKKVPSPIFDKGKVKVHKDLDSQRVQTEQAVGSQEENLERAKMIAEAANIYKETLSKLDHYKKK